MVSGSFRAGGAVVCLLLFFCFLSSDASECKRQRLRRRRRKEKLCVALWWAHRAFWLVSWVTAGRREEGLGEGGGALEAADVKSAEVCDTNKLDSSEIQACVGEDTEEDWHQLPAFWNTGGGGRKKAKLHCALQQGGLLEDVRRLPFSHQAGILSALEQRFAAWGKEESTTYDADGCNMWRRRVDVLKESHVK